MEAFQNLQNPGTQYLFFKIHLNLLTHKKTEQPIKRQPGHDGAGNPAISIKSIIYSEKTHNV